MKAIFLDVDGVLNNNHTRTTTFDGWCFVDDYLVKRLAQLVKQTGAKLILSSTWRDGWNRADETFNEPFFNQLRDKLREYGMEIYDALTLPLKPKRADAIREYLNNYRGEPITKFVILDDWYDMGEFHDHLWKINPNVGLCPMDIDGVTRMLSDEEIEI